MLPTIKLGDFDVSRLIIGGNPFSGNSHVSADLDEQMRDYFTTENIKKALFRSEECGLNAMQLRGDRHITRIIREYRAQGGKMHWIAQTASEIYPYENNIRQITSSEPIAIYHHGTVTDRLVKEGKYEELKNRLQVIRDSGKLTGLATHMPEVVDYVEENDWDIDFYMLSVHNLSKIDRQSSAITGKANEGEPFDDEDRFAMYKKIQATNKPVLAFKILSASRKCESSQTVKEAFEEAFTNIKPTDAVVVGMFPKEKDQIAENAKLVSEILTNK